MTRKLDFQFYTLSSDKLSYKVPQVQRASKVKSDEKQPTTAYYGIIINI
ncbi:conserved hypothetical protein [Trichinella spiralis]|nr:conserved hypothetical protein [Trichinella spiralis]